MNRLLVVVFVLALACGALGEITLSGQHIAILASGDVTDFGYNFIVNEGRVQMERALGITGTLWVPNIVDQSSAFAKMQELVGKGYRLIISSTADHAQAAAMAAQLFPQVSFVQNGGSSKLPNLSSLSYNGADMYYVAGFFCGLMTNNSKVGFIHPAPPEASVSTLNAFYVGVKTANPSAEVHVMFTGSYLNPDRCAGASLYLLEKIGVGMLAGQQDDFTLQIMAMNHSLLAVGVSGYSLRNLYGETVGMSVLRRWDGPLTAYANFSLNNTGVFHHDISASFASGYTYLDIPSYLVPTDVWNATQAQADVLSKNATKVYYCSQLVLDQFQNGTGGCLKNTTLFTSIMLNGIKNESFYYVPLDNLAFPNGTRIAVIVLVCILFLFTIVTSIGVYVLRRDAVMLASSPLFMGLVLLGVAMVFSAAIAWVQEPNTHSCEARIWLPSLGFTLCMGAMIIKNVRLWIIFDAELKRIRIRDFKLLLWTGVFLAMSILLLGLWTGLGKPQVEIQQGTAGLGKYQTRKLCSTNSQGDHILYSIIALHASQLLVGCFVTFKIRVIDIEEFNESRPFGLCIYVVSLVMTIAGILIGTGGIVNPNQIIIIVAFSLLIGSAAVMFLIFAPKFLTIFVKGERPMSRVMRGVAMSTSRSSKGSRDRDSGTSSTSSVAPNSKTIVLTDQV